MDILPQIRVMQALKNLDNTQTAVLIGTSRQNFSNKCKRNNFTINDLQKISNALGFDMEIIFTDRETGKKI